MPDGLQLRDIAVIMRLRVGSQRSQWGAILLVLPHRYSVYRVRSEGSSQGR